MPASAARVFDTVLVQQDGVWAEVTVREFFALPLSARIEHIIRRTVVFKRGELEVDQKEALAAVRSMRSNGNS